MRGESRRKFSEFNTRFMCLILHPSVTIECIIHSLPFYSTIDSNSIFYEYSGNK